MNEKKIDLHGLTERAAIRKLVQDYNAYVRSGGRDPIWVIHGYGSSGRGGVLQQAVRRYLAEHADRFESVVEGDLLANPGATIVYPKRLLPQPPQPRP
jgi:DNA-nicking Smr family endonuclease